MPTTRLPSLSPSTLLWSENGAKWPALGACGSRRRSQRKRWRSDCPDISRKTRLVQARDEFRRAGSRHRARNAWLRNAACKLATSSAAKIPFPPSASADAYAAPGGADESLGRRRARLGGAAESSRPGSAGKTCGKSCDCTSRRWRFRFRVSGTLALRSTRRWSWSFAELSRRADRAGARGMRG